MRKTINTLIYIGIFILMTSCSFKQPTLKGFYQSDFIDGYIVQMSFDEDNSFILYIDNREVSNGTYEIGHNFYKLKSDNQEIIITLNEDNSFKFSISKLNNGIPFYLKNLSHLPTEFLTEFDDTEEYKKLLE